MADQDKGKGPNTGAREKTAGKKATKKKVAPRKKAAKKAVPKKAVNKKTAAKSGPKTASTAIRQTSAKSKSAAKLVSSASGVSTGASKAVVTPSAEVKKTARRKPVAPARRSSSREMPAGDSAMWWLNLVLIVVLVAISALLYVLMEQGAFNQRHEYG